MHARILEPIQLDDLVQNLSQDEGSLWLGDRSLVIAGNQLPSNEENKASAMAFHSLDFDKDGHHPILELVQKAFDCLGFYKEDQVIIQW